MFFEQTQIFQESLSKRNVFSRKFYLFVEQTLLSHRTDTNFPRNPYLVLEHIQIFQETPMPRTHRHFPGRYPLSNRYFVNRSRWLLSNRVLVVITIILEIPFSIFETVISVALFVTPKIPKLRNL